MKRLLTLICMMVAVGIWCHEANAQDKTVKKIIELGQTDNNVMKIFWQMSSVADQ